MFLKIGRHFKVENVFILLESSCIGGIYVHCISQQINLNLYTYQKVVK